MKGTYKAISLRLPIGLYNRLQELADKAHINMHAYCVKRLWTDANWKKGGASND